MNNIDKDLFWMIALIAILIVAAIYTYGGGRFSFNGINGGPYLSPRFEVHDIKDNERTEFLKQAPY